MKLVAAIFILLSSLSAQVICRPTASKDSLVSMSETSRNVTADLGQRYTEYAAHSVRCFDRIHGTFALGGKMVDHLDVEVEPYIPLVSDAGFCSASRSGDPLAKFKMELQERRQNTTEFKRMTVPAELCRTVKLATSH